MQTIPALDAPPRHDRRRRPGRQIRRLVVAAVAVLAFARATVDVGTAARDVLADLGATLGIDPASPD